MMTPQQFSAYVTSSVPVATNEDGDTQQNYANAHGPAFSGSVTINSANGAVNHVNPLYCATDDCARQLCDLIKAIAPDLSPVVTHDYPYPFTPSSWDWFSTFVPYITCHFDVAAYSDNAGLLAQVFSHGYEPNNQLRYMVWEIRANAFAEGKSSIDPGSFGG